MAHHLISAVSSALMSGFVLPASLLLWMPRCILRSQGAVAFECQACTAAAIVRQDKVCYKTWALTLDLVPTGAFISRHTAA